MRLAKHFLVVCLVLLGLGVAWLSLYALRDHLCRSAVAEAQAIAGGGYPLGAIQLLDRTDSWCRCEAFTGGDAPPEYSALIHALAQLRREDGDAAVDEAVSEARGPLLKDIARGWEAAVIEHSLHGDPL